MNWTECEYIQQTKSEIHTCLIIVENCRGWKCISCSSGRTRNPIVISTTTPTYLLIHSYIPVFFIVVYQYSTESVYVKEGDRNEEGKRVMKRWCTQIELSTIEYISLSPLYSFSFIFLFVFLYVSFCFTHSSHSSLIHGYISVGILAAMRR